MPQHKGADFSKLPQHVQDAVREGIWGDEQPLIIVPDRGEFIFGKDKALIPIPKKHINPLWVLAGCLLVAVAVITFSLWIWWL